MHIKGLAGQCYIVSSAIVTAFLEVICNLSNDTISNDLEQPLTLISTNVSEMVQDGNNGYQKELMHTLLHTINRRLVAW